MKRLISAVCLLALLATLLCGCVGYTCEYCGEKTLAYNRVGDEVDGIQLCNTCIDKMRMNQIWFLFICDGCEQEKLGKENEITVGGEAKVVCNTCNKYFEENGALPK